MMVVSGMPVNVSCARLSSVAAASPIVGNRVLPLAVLLYDCHGGGNQQWRIAADGWRNPQSGRCLTAVAAGLAITDCTGAANQRFSLT